ncbi:hydrocephalus-inducing protein-like [Latimeria chalumnae]|uniref:hydrocephalus-inducing protein-like n=1 Tax=Latimeria chalumnae TaxID=7897 RepID=UPI00313E3319
MVFTLLDSPKAEEIIRKSYVYVSIFFPHPDGTGILYILHGMADPPKAVATINREMPSKTVYTEVLSVNNWLRKLVLAGENVTNNPLYSMFDDIVTFRNEVTQEYLHYVVNFKALSPGMLSTIELVTVIRQSTSSMVKVENPLSIPVTFTVDCKTQDISFPLQLTVPAQSEGSLMFEQLPLRPREFTGRIALQTNELGLFQYGLLLKAIPARSEKPMYFGTFLGKSQGVSAKIMNYCRQQVEFTCKIEGSYFHIEKTIYTAPGSLCGTKISIEVTYEPSQIGESRGVLNISSPVAGEYVIPLFGTCSTPKPQGPFVVVTGANTSISFNNIFPQTTAFTYQVDNPVFSVKASETIHFKKSHSISVSYEGNPNGTKTPSTGRLFVSCPRFTGMGQNITWVYYLKGIPSEK